MVGQKHRPSAIDPANENFELRPTPVSPFLYGGVANFSWALHNLHNLHADCTFKREVRDIKGAAPVRATLIFYVFGYLPEKTH